MIKLIRRGIILLALALLVFIAYIGVKIRQDVKRVLTYDEQVTQAVEQYGITQYKDIVLAIIYTESKGNTIDLMQSSESKYGERLMIDTPEESIELGVSFLAESIEKSEDEGCDIWTAIQAYNFGLDYINYVKIHGGENTLTLAERYSKEILAPLLGNHDEHQYRYYRPQAILHNGGFLYSNGGNMFYADIVKMNRGFIRLVN